MSVRNAVINVRTQLLILILFGFLNVISLCAASDRSSQEGEHLGGAGAREGVGSPGTSNADAASESTASDESSGGGLGLSFRYEPACASYNPPGTANSAAPFGAAGGAGGTGMNDLSCNEDYNPVPPPPVQQAGEIGILGGNPDTPKLVPPNKASQSRGVTEVNPDR